MNIKTTAACVSAVILSIGCLGTATAQTSPYVFENGQEAASRGVINVGGAVFDSTDLGKIYTEVNNGKSAIAERMVNTAGVSENTLKEGGIYTFEKLMGGVDAVYNSGKEQGHQEIIDDPVSYGLGTGELVLIGKVQASAYDEVNSVDITVDPSLYSGYILLTNHWGGDFGPYFHSQSVEVGDTIPGINGGMVVGYLPASEFKWPDYTADTYSDPNDYHMFIVQAVQNTTGGLITLGYAWWKTPTKITLKGQRNSQMVYLVGVR